MSRSWVAPNNKGAGYNCCWIDPDKIQRQRTFRLKADADAFRAKKERELDTGTYLEAQRGAETVAGLFERWATSRGVENSSVRQYRSMLNQAIRPFFESKTTGALKLADVQAWILWMRDTKNYAPQTMQTRFGYLSSALQWAVDNDELGRNPAKRAKLPGKRANVRRKVKGKIVVPDLDDIEALIAAFDPRYAAMVWVMAGCGLRIAEAMGLCADQIDFRGGLLHVNRQITEDGATESGKNAGLQLKMYTKHRDLEDPGRTVPLPQIVADVLRAHIKQFGTVAWQSSEGPVKLLFPNHTRKGLLYQYYFRNEVWLAALTASRVSFDRTHALRHFFASSMLADGVPITDVAEWLGHASPEITHDFYGHLMPDAPDRGRTAIDNAMASLAGVTATGGTTTSAGGGRAQRVPATRSPRAGSAHRRNGGGRGRPPVAA